MSNPLTFQYINRGNVALILPASLICMGVYFLVMRNSICLEPRHSATWSTGQCLGLNLLVAFAFVSSGLFGLLSIWATPYSKRKVILEGDAISAPEQGIRAKFVKVNFSDIHHVRVTMTGRDQILDIQSNSGNLRIPKSRLSRDEDFDWLVGRMKTLTESASTQSAS